jgi:hypothetical protein
MLQMGQYSQQFTLIATTAVYDNQNNTKYYYHRVEIVLWKRTQMYRTGHQFTTTKEGE